jgi:ATP-binding cassette subfamily F protein 3
MISIDSINVSFGSKVLLDDVSFLVNSRDRIGLTGKNGAGKTTLLRILAGKHKPSAGRVATPSDLSIGYLPQQMDVSDHTSILNESLKAFSEISSIQNKIDAFTHEISSRTDYESDSYMKTCDMLADLQEEYKLRGGDNIHAETEIALTGLGFSRQDFDRPTNQLSGGWRMRIELAKIILRKPSLLLLDEPTNHLDIESIEWLEGFLKSYPGEVILVSHDRAFLDNITSRTIEISLGKLFDYKVPYTRYTQLRKERKEQQLAAYRNQKKMIDTTERFIERFRYKNTKSIQVQSRIKHLDKLDRIEIEEEDVGKINIKFEPAPRSGAIVIETEQLTKSYGDNLVLNNIDLIIERGEKVAFVGKNGEGKSTLSKIIMEQIDYEGVLKTGHNLKIGYFAQNQDELLNEKLSVFQTIDNIASGGIRTSIRDILGAFLFSGDDIEKKVKVLSGGERSRLALIKLLLEPYNLLLLDEPTNHLDIRSKEILKQALLRYDGTLIVVSHDRDFLDGLIEKVYEFHNKKVKEHRGSIYEFLEKKKLDNLKELERKKASSKKESGVSSVSANKLSYLERKELDKKIRKLEKDMASLEENIEGLENERKEIEQQLSVSGESGEYKEGEIFTRYEEVKSLIDDSFAKWEITSENLTKLK